MLDNKIIGERLKACRESTGEKQIDIANLLNAQRQIVSYYETGARMPNIEDLALLAKHFNTSVDYLLGLSDIKSTDTDLIAVCKYTGLSEDAADTLHQIADESENYNSFGEDIIQFCGEDLNQKHRNQRAAYLDFINYCFYDDEMSDFMGVLEYATEYKNQLLNWNARAKKLIEDFNNPKNANYEKLWKIYDERAEMTKYDYIKIKSYVHEAADCLKMLINNYVDDLVEEQEKNELLLVREINPFRLSDKINEGE